MSVFGIVCETNPIHNGHKLLIDTAKEMGASTVVCVMSGNSVQRGEFAIADKYVRAEALLRCGADLVLELPFPWSSSSAEYFALAAVSMLRHFCDKVIFGSECGNINILSDAAEYAGGADFKREYNILLADGAPAAGTYFKMLERCTGETLSSNDLLGIEYIKAAKKLQADLKFVTLRRKGDGYTSKCVTERAYPSAMAVRKLWRENITTNMSEYMPQEAVEIYSRAVNEKNIMDDSVLDTVLLTFFRMHTGSDFEGVVGASGGLANRICEMSHKASSADELLALVKNKRYTDSNIRRTMLYCMAGVERQQIEALPEETLLLAANAKGRELLATNRKKEGMKILSKPADLDMSLPQNILAQRIDSIYTLLFNKKQPSDKYIKKGPIII